MNGKINAQDGIEKPEYLRVQRYVYSQTNFDQYLKYLIEKGKCPESWTKIIELGLASTETSARSLDRIARTFGLIDNNHQLTPLAIEIRTVSGRAQAFRQILERFYPDLLEITHKTPEESRDLTTEDYLKRLGVLSIDPRVRTVRMFKYLLKNSGIEISSTSITIPNPDSKRQEKQKPEPLHDIIHAKKVIPEKSTVDEVPTKAQVTSSAPGQMPRDDHASKKRDDTPIIGGNQSDENIFQILTSVGRPIIIRVPAGVTTDDIKSAIKLLEAAYIS